MTLSNILGHVLRPLVQALQTAESRVRGRRSGAQGLGHPSHQDRRHEGEGAGGPVRRRRLAHAQDVQEGTRLRLQRTQGETEHHR